MNFLLPQSTFSIVLLAAVLAVEFFIGFMLVRHEKFQRAAWLFPMGAVLVIHFFTWDESAVFRMLALVIVLLTGMKVVMATHYPHLKFTFGKWCLYCFTWVGMNPEIFFKHRASADRSLLYRGLLFFLSGIFLLFILKFILVSDSIPAGLSYHLLSLILLIGLSQILHFGLLNISAWFLQVLKYPAYALFRAPLSAESLRDFWGKRWNLAFTEMTSVAVYRPLSQRTTPTRALLACFIFSGLLHEVALSFPVRTGYGLPLLYFAVQLFLIIAEEKFFRRKPGKVWVILGLILPLPILFHPAIMKAVFWQFVL